MQIFVSAIGTEVGKTVASAVLCSALNASYWKPVQSGAESDSDTRELERLVPNLKTLPERHVYQAPLSPHIAAKLEGKKILLSDFQLPNEPNLVIEGAGGLMVPLNDQDLMIDLIKQMKLACVLVANSYLGSINHTLLSIAMLEQKGIPLLGIIFNGNNFADNAEIIEKYSGARILHHIPQAEELNAAFITEQGKQLADNLKKLNL